MYKNLTKDQRGIAHILYVALIIVILAGVVAAGLIVSKNQNKTKAALAATAKSSSTKNKRITSTPSTTSPIAGATALPANQAAATSPKASTASVAHPAVAAQPATTAQPPAPASFNAQGYSNIGTISAASLYNVKVPPSGTQQPNMTIYACNRNLGANTASIQAVGVLSYAIPQANSSAWFVNLDLSSSASADNPVSSKAGTYSYETHSWQNSGGSSNQSSPITSAALNPGVISDFYVWASGSYNGTTWNVINNHANVTQLAACR